MSKSKPTSIRLSSTARQKLTWLTGHYGNQTTALEIAIDRLYVQERDESWNGRSRCYRMGYDDRINLLGYSIEMGIEERSKPEQHRYVRFDDGREGGYLEHYREPDPAFDEKEYRQGWADASYDFSDVARELVGDGRGLAGD